MGEQINSYRDLRVWQGAMALAESCYLLTKSFPRAELFGLTSQIRRASASIAANIAEGHGREGTQQFIQYLRIAQGSLKELETLLLLSQRVEVARQSDIDEPFGKCQSVGKMLRTLIRTLQEKS